MRLRVLPYRKASLIWLKPHVVILPQRKLHRAKFARVNRKGLRQMVLSIAVRLLPIRHASQRVFLQRMMRRIKMMNATSVNDRPRKMTVYFKPSER